MSRSQKPAILVAAVLCALIVLPVLVLMISKSGSGASTSTNGALPPVQSSSAIADFDLRQLAERADQLLEGELADALRQGDLSLDWIAGLKKNTERAAHAMQSGKQEKAKALYTEVITTAEMQLEAIRLADKARALNESTYAELTRLDYLKTAFEKTHREAVETYNAALQSLNAGAYKECVDGYEMTGAILSDLEARALKQMNGLLESANTSLQNYELEAARNAYNEVLKIDAGHAAATEGLVTVQALEGIADEVKAVRELEAEGLLDEALAQIEALSAQHPQNAFIQKQRASIQERILDREIAELVQAADTAEAAGDFEAAVQAIESALALRADAPLQQRLVALKAKAKAARLETLLATGYDALKSGRYKEARDLYKEATALAPESKEAATGYQKASSLHLANIRYSQNIASAAKAVKEGRFPRAAEFFNAAMGARPNTVPVAQQKEEERLRAEIKLQSVEVPVQVRSDKKTFVSIIGVLPPTKSRTENLNLFPDVYIVKGSRSGYKPVELELRVDARNKNHSVEVICREKL